MPTPFVSNWQTQARKGLLELVVLNALRGGRMYGYELAKSLRRMPALTIVEGTIYPIMSRLEREGLVTSSLEASTEGPARKYYRLSRDGRAALERLNRVWDELVDGVAAVRADSE